MLCDDLTADLELAQTYDGLDLVYEKIRSAQKFILGQDFAVAADGLVENLDELRRIIPYCRVPFPLTWVEWAHDDRPHWNPAGPYGARAVDRTRHQRPPRRVGLLLQQKDGRASKWTAHLFWSTKDKPVDGSFHNGSIQATCFDTENTHSNPDPLLAFAAPGLAEFGHQLITDLLTRAPAVGRRLLEYSVEDWGGEVRFMIATLGLLNCRNVAQTVTVDNTVMNEKRAKNNKRPLFSHTLLKVRSGTVIVSRPGASASQQSHDLRLHFVRGHFKHRKTGLFWWSNYMRGERQHGVIEKEYELT
jgi:hypothetical protein